MMKTFQKQENEKARNEGIRHMKEELQTALDHLHLQHKVQSTFFQPILSWKLNTDECLSFGMTYPHFYKNTTENLSYQLFYALCIWLLFEC